MNYKIVEITVQPNKGEMFLRSDTLVNIPDGSIVVDSKHSQAFVASGGLRSPESWTFTCLVPQA